MERVKIIFPEFPFVLQHFDRGSAVTDYKNSDATHVLSMSRDQIL